MPVSPGSGGGRVERADGRRAGSPWRRASGRCAPPSTEAIRCAASAGTTKVIRPERGGCRPGCRRRWWPRSRRARACGSGRRRGSAPSGTGTGPGWRRRRRRPASRPARRRPPSPRRSVTRMFTKSPGTSRPATPRTWSTEMVMATSLFFSRLRERGQRVLLGDELVASTTTWLAARSEMATRPSICDGSVIAVAGRYSLAISSCSMRPCAKASSPKVPFGMSWTILKISHPLGVVVGLVFDASDVREQRVGRDGADERRPRSGSAFDESSHPPLLGLDLPQGRPNLSSDL